VLAAGALAACGGSDGGRRHASLSEREAETRAREAVASLPQGEGRTLALESLEATRDAAGNDVWLARFEDAAGGPAMCVTLSGRPGAAGTSLRACTNDADDAPPIDEPPATETGEDPV
jgi:hypothetical protein